MKSLFKQSSEKISQKQIEVLDSILNTMEDGYKDFFKWSFRDFKKDDGKIRDVLATQYVPKNHPNDYESSKQWVGFYHEMHRRVSQLKDAVCGDSKTKADFFAQVLDQVSFRKRQYSELRDFEYGKLCEMDKSIPKAPTHPAGTEKPSELEDKNMTPAQSLYYKVTKEVLGEIIPSAPERPVSTKPVTKKEVSKPDLKTVFGKTYNTVEELMEAAKEEKKKWDGPVPGKEIISIGDLEKLLKELPEIGAITKK